MLQLKLGCVLSVFDRVLDYSIEANAANGNGATPLEKLDEVYKEIRGFVAAQLASATGTNGSSHASAAPTTTKSTPVSTAPTGPTNGNGDTHGGSGEGLSIKQRNFALGLAARVGIKGIGGLNTKAQELFGKPLATLTRAEGSSLIDHLKAAGEEAKS
jgi:hypothetical protein